MDAIDRHGGTSPKFVETILFMGSAIYVVVGRAVGRSENLGASSN